MYRPYIKPAVQVSDSYYIKQYASLYNYPPYADSGATIFICSFGGGLYGTQTVVGEKVVQITNGDVQQYWLDQAITNPSNVYVYLEEPMDFTDSMSTLENTLDCSCAGSICKSTIVLCLFSQMVTFEHVFTTMFQGITINNSVVKPTHISVSWGCPESQISKSDIDRVPSIIMNSGINVCVAAGDNGSNDGTNELSCDFPASCPYVIAVGGTSIRSMNPFKEVVWNDKTCATGGGISKVFKRPSYQKSGFGPMRNVPDVAFLADPLTGICLYLNGELHTTVGGTSMSAPCVTAFLALVGSIDRSFQPLVSKLYNYPLCCNSEIPGNNMVGNMTKYSSQVGYDNCTGLGTLKGNLLDYLKPPVIHVKTVAVPRQITISNSVTLPVIISPRNATNQIVRMISSNPSIATVFNGVITPIQSGKCIILVTCGVISITVVVTVKLYKISKRFLIAFK